MADTNRRAPDYVLLAVTLALSVFGLVMVYSSSFFVAVNEGHGQTYYVARQTGWMAVGVALMFAAMRFDYWRYRKAAVLLFFGTIFLLVLTLLLPDHITSANGASRWLRLGPIQFQPTEVAKFTLIVYLAAWLISRGDDKIKSMSYGLLPFALVVGFFCGLMFLQPNLSSAALIALIASTIYFAAGANLLHIAAGVGGAGMLGYTIVRYFPHSSARLTVFADPWIDPRGAGFQPIHSLYALASGGVFGRGLGQSREKFLWLFSPHADSIFSIIGEELGLIGTVGLVSAFLLLAYRGYRIAARSHDPFAALMAIGITSWITFQAFLNMAVVSNLIPYTGQTLPFISYGGTSLAMCLFAMGVLLNISKHVDDQRPEPVASPIVERSRAAAKPRKRRAIGVVPAFAAFVRRGNRGPRVSGAGRGVSFARTGGSAAATVSSRGWRRFSTGEAPRRQRRARSAEPTASGGTWRKR